MSRNYKKEAEWAKKKYCRILIDIDREIGERFKEKAREENKSYSEILKEFIKTYINE